MLTFVANLLSYTVSLGIALSKTSGIGWSTTKAALGGIVHQGHSSSAHVLAGRRKQEAGRKYPACFQK